MKKIVIFILILVPLISFSQDWAKHNSVWHFNQINWTPPWNTSFITMSYSRDTVIQSHQSVIIREEFFAPLDTLVSEFVMMSDSNRIYFYEPSVNEFKPLYDFNLMPGDTMEVYCRNANTDSTIIVTIDSVSTIDFNGHNLKVQYISSSSGYPDEFNMNGMVIENIGCTSFMFPFSEIADPPYGGELRCYEDTTLGFKQYSAYDCDYLNTNVDEIALQEAGLFFPNPPNGKISINKSQFDEIKIVDSGGQTVYSGISNEISLSGFKSGIYILILLADQKVYSERFVIYQRD